MRKEIFIEGEYYHIYNRAINKIPIFRDDREKLRLVHTLYISNNFLCIPDHFNIYTLEPRDLLEPIEPYVEIAAGCIMPNHYHLLLSPLKKDGISKLLHKTGTSITKGYNSRHERTGRLFESTFKAKYVDKHEYATYLTSYIHLNPIDLAPKDYNPKEILKWTEEYKWSTLPDYLGKKGALSTLLLPSNSFRDKVLDLTKEEYSTMVEELLTERFSAS